MLLNSGVKKGSEGIQAMPELHNKMEIADRKNRTLIEQQGPSCRFIFTNTIFDDESDQDCFELPIWNSYSSTNSSASKSDNKRGGPREEEQVFLDDLARLQRQEKEANEEAKPQEESLKNKLELMASGRSC
ncbi:hypothetical protein Tco_0990002 [Tanacetum coccineum]|uniref:Uncharacterized protein n=1 Tax=Tanacetum coccineum TaxID=301880 RepID=A0ABQ5EW05_9ASTR